MQVLLISTDLMVASMLQGPADAAGLELVTARPASVAERADSSTTVALIDLASPMLDVLQLVEDLREAAPAAQLIAFGPHVHVDKLELARQAGCDRVMSRGELHAKAHALMAEFAS